MTQTWNTLDQNNQFPVLDYCLKYDTDNTDCSSTCKDTDPDLQNGQFKWNRLSQIWEVMEQIRTWGSVVTRLDVYDDFKPFFKKTPDGIYPGQGKFPLVMTLMEICWWSNYGIGTA